MSRSLRIYLAGPEVFLPDPFAMADKKKALCGKYGFEGVFPLDSGLKLSGLEPERRGHAISRANEDLMRTCDLLIANLTPFRGPSADAGTVFELGFARALGLPLFGYSNDPRDFERRTAAWLGLASKAPGEQVYRDDHGMAVEAFGLRDNLMIDGAIHLCGGRFFTHNAERHALYTDLTAFEQCLATARERVLTSGAV